MQDISNDNPELINPHEKAEFTQLQFPKIISEADISNKNSQSKKLVAFGGFVKSELYDMFGEHNIEDLTEDEKNWISAGKLRELVLSPQPGDKFLVDGISLNTYEYNLIVRSPEYLGKFASARVLNDYDVDDERVSASKRAAMHVFEQKLDGMTTHLSKLVDQKLLIKELTKEVNMPGFAHKTSERMKQLISGAWNEFMTMLDVVHLQRGWDDDKRSRAEATLIHYLTSGGQSDRISKWKSTIKVADNYLTQRKLLFTRRIRTVKSELDEYHKFAGVEEE